LSLGGAPTVAARPALFTLQSEESPCFSSSAQNRPSAIGLRQVFPVQIKYTFFMEVDYPFASYHVFPILASLFNRTFILQAFSISSETIFAACSASASGASTINSSCSCNISFSYIFLPLKRL